MLVDVFQVSVDLRPWDVLAAKGAPRPRLLDPKSVRPQVNCEVADIFFVELKFRAVGGVGGGAVVISIR